jgi:hypothetical protein
MTEIVNSATFTIKVLDIGTTTVGTLKDVVKQVTWTIKGSKGGKSSEEVQYTTVLDDPNPESYIPLADLTEDKVVEFIVNSDIRVPNIKNYLETGLDIEIAKDTLAKPALPWAAKE